MAYNLESFIQILEKDQHHLTLGCRTQISCLLDGLRDIVKNSPPAFTRGIQHLDSQIRDFAHQMEDLVESHIIDQVLSHCDDGRAFQLDLTSLMEEFNSIREKMSSMSMEEMSNMLMDDPPPALEDTGPSPNKTVVGLDEDVKLLLDQLTRSEPKELQVIPIVGMGGVGKTTLARTLYTHSKITSSNHFDCVAWITISQQFDARRTLCSLLNCFGLPTHEMHKENCQDLGVHVHQNLYGRRYLIVVDDIWETEAWDRLRMFFPNQNNGSRIILTTRQWEVANCVRSGDYVHEMCILDEHDSWSLLAENVFGQETCPLELVETGRRIANNCGGLPLSIIVMAGHLFKSEKTLEFWNSVERDFKSTSATLDPRLEILSKSYNHLPYHLKPCFLYVSAFPQFDEIRASRIIKLWTAEGIVRRVDDKPLEEVAHGYLTDLIERSLLSVCQLESNGKVRTFKIHHLLRELCQKKALEEKFLWMRNADDLEFLEGEGIMRRVCVHSLYQAKSVHLSRVRSYLCFSDAGLGKQLCANLRLLRVLDVLQLEFVKFPTEIEQLINLRYLGLSCRSRLPPSVFQFLNLQTFIIRLPLFFGKISLPSQFWEMTQLMHIKFKDTCIWYRPRNGQTDIQKNLETLSNVEASGVRELLPRVPNLRKLGIHYDTPIDTDIDLTCLEKLEKLKCSSVWPSTHEFLSFLHLPDSLKKLSLNRCEIPVEFITKVGLLPHLEQLRLHGSDFFCEEGEPAEPRWEPAEGGFCKLISLVMEDLNLVHWAVDDASFPVLERLEIRGCSSMEEISLEIGATETLKLIKVDQASEPLLDSVRRMELQQHEVCGNYSLEFDLPAAS